MGALGDFAGFAPESPSETHRIPIMMEHVMLALITLVTTLGGFGPPGYGYIDVFEVPVHGFEVPAHVLKPSIRTS